MANEKSVFNWQFYLGFVLVVTGGLFLADQLLETHLMSIFWPLLVVLFGITFIVGMIFAGKKGAGLGIPGAIITTSGILLFIQNTFDLWITWTYAWALLISATGVGLLLMNIYLKKSTLRKIAGWIIGIGLTLFVLFGVFFEVVLDVPGTSVNSGLFLGGGMVLLGLFIIFSRPLFAEKRKEPKKEEEKEPEEEIEAVEAEFKEAEEVEEGEEVEAVEELEEVAPTEEVLLEPLPEESLFTGIHFKSVGEVHLIQSDSCSLKMEGPESLITKVKTDVQEGVLTIIYDSDDADWSDIQWMNADHDIRYYVNIENLQTLNIEGAGSVQGPNLHGESLSINHTGSGNIVLKGLQYQELDLNMSGLGEIQLAGEVQKQNLDVSGAGNYKAENLRSQEANVTLSGSGLVQVWVEEELNADLSGAGSIEYKGEPKIEESNTGVGSIKPL